MSAKKQLLVRIPEDLKAWLEERAGENLRTVSSELQVILSPVKAADEAATGEAL